MKLVFQLFKFCFFYMCVTNAYAPSKAAVTFDYHTHFKNPFSFSSFYRFYSLLSVAGSGFTCGLATKPPSKSVAGVMAALADTSLNPASQSHNQRHQAQIFVSDVAPSGSVQPANPDTCSAVLLHGRTVQDMAPSTSGAPSCSVSRGGPGEGS